MPPRLNAWTHVAGVYDPMAQHAYLYVDGVLAGSATIPPTWSAGGRLNIGLAKWNGGVSDSWAGDIDDVAEPWPWATELAAAFTRLTELPDPSPEPTTTTRSARTEQPGPGPGHHRPPNADNISRRSTTRLQLGGHLRRALDNGLAKDELIEAIIHLAFYAGWPSAMTAITTLKNIVEPSPPGDE